MRHLKTSLLILQCICAISIHAEEYISIPSTLFYNKLRFGMTPEMVSKSLDTKGSNIGCKELTKEDFSYRSGVDQKLCVKNLENDNGDNIEYKLYYVNNQLVNIISFYKPVDKSIDLDVYFNEKMNSLRKVIKGANITCTTESNNRKRCSFHTPIASIDFSQYSSGVMISVRPPYLLAEEYERKESNGPVYVSIYGLEVGKSKLDDLKNSAVKNNWKVRKKEELFAFNNPNQTTYIIKLPEPSDVHTLLAEFEGDTLMSFTYWFIDPYGVGGKSVKSDINYLNLLSGKYGNPYSKSSGDYQSTEWRVNRGFRNEVEIRTDQTEGLEMKYIRYTDVRLDTHRNIQDINKRIDEMVKRVSVSKIDL